MAANVMSHNYHFEVLRTDKNRDGKWNVKRRSFNDYEQARRFVSNDVDYSTLNMIMVEVDNWHFYAGDDLVKTIQIRLVKNVQFA